MAGASELIAYQGNPVNGVGGNADIPVTTTGALNPVNAIGRDIMLLNHENNLRLYQQKVKDRDTLYGLLAAGEASTGAIRDEDRQVYNDAKNKANEAFLQMAKSGGINNPEAVKSYKEKVDYLNQVATQAQARYKLIGDDEKTIASETRPLIRQDMQKNVDAWKGNFWGNYEPYQKAYDYDVFKMRNKYLGGALQGEAEVPTATTDVSKVVNKDGKITTTNVQKTAPLKGKQPLTGETVMENGLPYNVTKGGRVDFNKIMNNVVSDYQENKDFGAEDQRALLKGIEGLPVASQQEYLGNLLKKAQQYNAENGLAPDENGNYPSNAINIDRLRSKFVPRDPNDLSKGFHVALQPPELAALDALASLDRYVEPDKKTLDKDAAKLLEDARHNRAMEAAAKDKNAINWRKLHNSEKQQTAIETVGKQKVTDLINATQTTFMSNDPLMKEGANGYVDVTKIPGSRQFIVGIVYDDKGKPKIGQLKPFTRKLPNGEERQVYNTTYFSDGGKKINGAKDLSPELEKQYGQFKQLYGKDGNWNNYLKALANNGLLTPQWEGENGTATVNSIMEGQRYEAAKAGKKGFENVYEEEQTTE